MVLHPKKYILADLSKRGNHIMPADIIVIYLLQVKFHLSQSKH